MSQPVRVIAYIDGFNLYYGLRTKGWRRYLWLDLQGLTKSLLLPHQVLVGTKYFTARISSPPDSVRRQTTYLDALEAHGHVERIEGKFQPKVVNCHACGAGWTTHEEKQTDVNIAVEMVRDAHIGGLMDMALLISADSDLAPPVKATIDVGKRVIVACPPARYSDVLINAASGSIPIYRTQLANNQLPNPVTQSNGYELWRPAKWW
jgi:hypothetical protein